ncbi:MAG: ATP phosphoribosyltransferase regulatory subunit [Marinagarivorans sp.]|nr:ATP phosphoribosyltransferase regulatory subunit [Marinagarivorans sp.]
MNQVDRWMLPDGIEEILPDEAQPIEALRRRLLDLFQRWGYDLIIPSMAEFTESLLIGLGQDLDLQTFKVTDQLSGRTLGIRADITPQAARIDAHSLRREGINRLCYAGHVLYTRPKSALASRNPLQIGVELFGDDSIESDIEVISLLLSTLKEADLESLHVDLGHVGIFRSLAAEAGLNSAQEAEYFTLLQAKALADINAWVDTHLAGTHAEKWLKALPRLAGSANILAEAKTLFANAPADVRRAVDQLVVLAETLSERYPSAHLYFDLSELRGYNYHTGVVFAAFAAGVGEAIATGGRYDHIGEVFGRARPATGFSVNLVALKRLAQPSCELPLGIFALYSTHPAQWQAVEQLRNSGERVVSGATWQTTPNDYQSCDRILIERDGCFEIDTIE